MTDQNTRDDARGCGDEDQEHEHHFPLLGDVQADPEIGDCACGVTFDQDQADRAEALYAY